MATKSPSKVSSIVQANPALRRSTRLLSLSSTTVLVQANDEAITPHKPENNSRKRKRSPPQDILPGDQLEPQDKELDDKTNKTFKRKSILKQNQIKEDDELFHHSPSKPTNRKRIRERQPTPVYTIPDVVRKETSFRGRLGYACLNTILRNKKPATNAVFCSRTCRLDSLRKNGIDWVKSLGRKNAQDLSIIIEWNENNNIRFFRISSELFPFASHADHGYSLDYCADELAKAGAIAKKYGHRLTTHPGQYTQLGSPKPAVVESAIRELDYHAQILDLMGLGPDSVMVIHGGGVYGDKPTTLSRLKETIRNLSPNIRSRLVLENDEICYNAEDLLPLCEELDIPLVFDYHHDNLFPSSISPAEIIERANIIWHRRGIKPKQHLSEPRPGAVTIMERRAHADRCENLPNDLPNDMDLMIEAKDKEQAVLYLYRMYNLQPVNHASLRPAKAMPSKQTNGRKSTSRARINAGKGAANEEAKGGMNGDDSSQSPGSTNEDEDEEV